MRFQIFKFYKIFWRLLRGYSSSLLVKTRQKVTRGPIRTGKALYANQLKEIKIQGQVQLSRSHLYLFSLPLL